MREDIAKMVYPVFEHGLELHERVRRGERPNLESEQTKLKGLLGRPLPSAPWGRAAGPVHSAAEVTPFLGVRYALACWLDELFINHSPQDWSDEWNANKLELALFETQIRYEEFWRQVQLAESSPGGSEALGVYWLCVLLGFRGRRGENQRELADWVRASRSRASKSGGKDVPAVPERVPVTDVPELTAVRGYRTMTVRLTWAVMLAVPVVAFCLVILSK